MQQTVTYTRLYTPSSVNGFFTVFILQLLLYPDVPFLYLECPFACVSGCSISLTVFSDLGALHSSWMFYNNVYMQGQTDVKCIYQIMIKSVFF